MELPHVGNFGGQEFFFDCAQILNHWPYRTSASATMELKNSTCISIL